MKILLKDLCFRTGHVTLKKLFFKKNITVIILKRIGSVLGFRSPPFFYFQVHVSSLFCTLPSPWVLPWLLIGNMNFPLRCYLPRLRRFPSWLLLGNQSQQKHIQRNPLLVRLWLLQQLRTLCHRRSLSYVGKPCVLRYHRRLMHKVLMFVSKIYAAGYYWIRATNLIHRKTLLQSLKNNGQRLDLGRCCRWAKDILSSHLLHMSLDAP